MSGPVDGLLSDMPPGWRRTIYGGIIAAMVTASYFGFVAGPIARAQETGDGNGKRIDKVDQDIAGTRKELAELNVKVERQDQKIESLKESAEEIKDKLDRLLTRDRRTGAYP
jgi:septal ring factor EnvC (AmiA/AmiB activator)